MHLHSLWPVSPYHMLKFVKIYNDCSTMLGKFLERTRVKLPDNSRYYEPQDFRLGAVIEANKHRYAILNIARLLLFLLFTNFTPFDFIQYGQFSFDRCIRFYFQVHGTT